MGKITKNCSTCKFGMFIICQTLKNNEEYQQIKEYKKIWEFKQNFSCDNYESIFIEYPIEVSKINNNINKSRYRGNSIGKFVKITPCSEEYKGKTFLGIYLGELPVGHGISYNPDTKELDVSFRNNPGVFVFDLNKIVYGYESFWGIIEKEEDLKEITDSDIENIWYVRALKSLSQSKNDISSEGLENKVRECVLNNKNNKRIIGFYPAAIIKDLNVDPTNQECIKQINKILTDMTTEGVLTLIYHYNCECDQNYIFEDLTNMPERCDFCDEEIYKDMLNLEYRIVR
ncbi:hypothetical protein [Alkaliphilus sp. B6464]|uniref:hypothetical protein n=1 Tax=Alkaliphilus sp. B6464 TaxID=2731219 RepID=UPI001BA5DC07|nr:hypothetical protein [Alkaliphilus sp. B6464]QUH21827.1 hypothetical protein HYG84_17985 [Alkaliphilus sp. B6464]